jgi:hypothetical protein
MLWVDLIFRKLTFTAVSSGNAVGAAFSHRRLLEPVEGRIVIAVALVRLGLAALFLFDPRVLANTAAVLQQ